MPSIASEKEKNDFIVVDDKEIKLSCLGDNKETEKLCK